MANVDRRSAIVLGAGIALLASSHASAQASGEAARNKEILAQAYKRWDETKGESVDEWMEIVAENISFGSLAEGQAMAPFTAPVKSKSNLKAYFAGLRESWSMVHFTPVHFIAEGDLVVMVGRTAWRNKATGKTFESPKVDVWRMRDGRAVEFYEYYDTAGVANAAMK